MKKIADDLLEALFALSNFEYDEKQKELWLAEFTKWLDFFSLDSYQLTDEIIALSVNGQLRADVVEESLTTTQLKSFATRLADGFFALPEVGER